MPCKFWANTLLRRPRRGRLRSVLIKDKGVIVRAIHYFGYRFLVQAGLRNRERVRVPGIMQKRPAFRILMIIKLWLVDNDNNIIINIQRRSGHATRVLYSRLSLFHLLFHPLSLSPSLFALSRSFVRNQSNFDGFASTKGVCLCLVSARVSDGCGHRTRCADIKTRLGQFRRIRNLNSGIDFLISRYSKR